MPVQLQLLGLPNLCEEGKTQPLRLNNPSLVLIYLAVKADWVSRSELAFLFRPDDDEASALKHLRLLLHRAKQLDWAHALELEQRRVRFRIPSDIAAFKLACSEQNWPLASRLYTAAFLGDFSPADLATYAAWLDLERADLAMQAQEALGFYARDLEAQGNVSGAAQVYADLLKFDPLNEDVLQAYLKVLYASGSRDRALRVFDDFSALLLKEFDAQPLEESLALVRLIRENKGLDSTLSKGQALSSSPPINNLPKQSTRFVGRKAELADLSAQLAHEDCRLLTLIGMGGSGKSRLALALASLLQHSFSHGVCFVPLAPLSSSDAVISALAQALGLTLAPRTEPLEQILAFLKDKKLLLVLDNFEHVLDAAPALTKLLQATEHLKMIVTSRESLKLIGEWLFDVEGLSYPDSEVSDGLESYDAVELFMSSAKRVAPRLEFSAADLARIAQISQRLTGLPLALELAASWARIMPIERIAKELSEGFELLESSQTDLPERHRNIKAMFEKTWAGLSEKKRETLAKFVIFQGGASLEAAEEVTGTHFSVLLSLVNESLLKRIPPNRFDIHELLKQFAAQHLDERQLNELRQLYVAYFSGFLHTYQARSDKEKLPGRNQLLKDIDNLRKNWNLILETVNTKALLLSTDAMYDLYFNKSFFYEGKTIFQEALAILEQLQPVNHELMGKILHSLGVFNMHQGNVHMSSQAFKKALISLKKANNIEEQAYVYKNLGLIAKQQGQLAQAVQELKNSLKLFRQLKDETGVAHALNSLGIILKNMEDFDQAQAYLLESLDTFEKLELEDDAAIANHNLGSIALMQGDYKGAKQHYLSSLRVFEKFDFRHGIAASNTNLGNIELKLGNYKDAIGFLAISIRLKKEIGDLVSLPEPLRQLGLSYRGMKNYHAAISNLLEAISLATGPQPQSLIIELLVDLADTLIEAGHASEAQEILALCLPYSSTEFIQSYIEPLQVKLKSSLVEVISPELQTLLEQNLSHIQSTYNMQPH
ncbi:MAG: tetratricopeptide repeat protein [Trueperaceae bacterium]|nr:tetratricopeptide repeat protein [Trueperaceae bacterium]